MQTRSSNKNWFYSLHAGAVLVATIASSSIAYGGDDAPVAEVEGEEMPAPARKPASSKPWRLAEAAGSPDWLFVGLEQRTRYEYLFDQFRAGRAGDGGLLSLRTSLQGEVRLPVVNVGAELLDARAYTANDVTAPNTTHVNALNLLQAYVELHVDDLAEDGDALRIKAGRLTMDIGSRRLVARNRFRNTINGFTGLDASYRTAGGMTLRTLATLPVQRRPTDAAAVRDNDIAFDRESFDRVFGGLFFASPALPFGLVIEGYALAIYERDGDESPTADRRLITPGVRLLRKKRPGGLDVEVELMAQVGRSRASRASGDTEDLDHLAVFQHVGVGYTFDVAATPRLVAQFDHASGDADSRDGSNNRFDTLFGARRFELGPTGIYGAFARSNIRSPGVRLELQPHAWVKGFVGYRAFWLASARDTWTTARIRDATGGSGSFVGHQLEGRVRFEPFAGNLRLEVGAAHLFPGGFLASAPDANESTASTTLYAQVIGRL